MVVFTYSGTAPATSLVFETDPPMGGYAINRKWMSPSLESCGGASYVYDKSLVQDIEKLEWKIMSVADVAALLAFLDVVDGSSLQFHYADVNGTYKYVFLWNSDEIRTYPIQTLREGVTLELFIVSAAVEITRLVKEDGSTGILTENGHNIVKEF